ncbi:MAG: DOMON-like domain-containing protein [Alphaproteobacteria bacterium]|nr:DOMON-like domain-containing protein [Alphaproteobacteria bacterium]MBV9371210.1 DOMON-like domain-containing protein [Alphaproteobacteria bacterium]MBV9899940.1 DOMON-like domain-containing protein [Alphaproteobacteria bacterium]
MEFVGKHRLVAHPRHPAKSVRSVAVGMWSGDAVMLSYAVTPATALALPGHGPERRDELWEHTCFELFVKPPGGSLYHELNFAPLSAWNAYSFSGWRQGRVALPLAHAPHFVDSRTDDRKSLFPAAYELDVVLVREAFLAPGARMSLTAVVEESDGTRSYWALAHPPGEPDFHHPDCFRLEVPPAGRP